jgi:hypothetical protein
MRKLKSEWRAAQEASRQRTPMRLLVLRGESRPGNRHGYASLGVQARSKSTMMIKYA